MRKFLYLMSMFAAASCGVAAATPFPYDAVLQERYRMGATTIASPHEPVDVPVVTEMPRTDSVATLSAEVVDFVATGAENWTAAALAHGCAEASLAMKCEDGSYVWMGYAGGEWVELSGPPAAEGAWSVKMDIDFSMGENARKIRYSVSKDGDEYVSLARDGETWLPIGVECERIGGVDLTGYGEVAGVVVSSGERPLQGNVVADERFGMDYTGLKIGVEATDTWGVSGVTVVLKDADGNVVASRKCALDGDVVVADFSAETAVPGGSYSYDVTLDGGYNGKELSRDVASENVDLFGQVDWFGFQGGSFDRATTTSVAVSDGVFSSSDAETVGSIVPNAAASEESEVVLQTRLIVSGARLLSELPDVAPQFALAMARLKSADGSSAGIRSWVCKTGGGAWTVASAEGVPTGNGTYDVKVSLDYRNGLKTGGGSYWIRQGEGEYIRLATFDLSAAKLNKLGIVGGGISFLNASYKTTNPVEVLPDETKKEISLKANAEIDVAKLQGVSYAVTGDKKYHLRWTDSTNNGATLDGAALKLIAKPVNGLESFDSYALGLDPTKELAKPAAVVKPGGLQSASGVTVYVPNVVKANLPDAGVEVLFQRQKSTNGGQTWTDDDAAVPVGGELTIPFTQGTLYRVNTVLK